MIEPVSIIDAVIIIGTVASLIVFAVWQIVGLEKKSSAIVARFDAAKTIDEWNDISNDIPKA